MRGFELRIFGVRSNCSANCAAPTAQFSYLAKKLWQSFSFLVWELQLVTDLSGEKKGTLKNGTSQIPPLSPFQSIWFKEWFEIGR